ncbi:hypothetical protein MW344_003576 [Vibrio parahaemolyticus]|uniref:hypothetical protein n=1 Tax=Vibrio parahaemolyticus TaxID=670 RepID=UPI00111E9F25|nr:hypothetical protein [Vibrio parahaemolyticus]EJB8438989.1 hypothetical protein [Vibrio parahaemolyticus]ELZ7200615.1 hypothetical protein [Vibrio parahaemolyticus]MDZ5121346.1 hypothetical protein [Vibrio parahaemolyticus]TNZ88329.1 hypothetical protein CGK40_22590 [Vibrio parahaemolyticus]TOG38858.1 hypothetical protein CGJ02_22645 [Vibrio parahaemolyticus]
MPAYTIVYKSENDNSLLKETVFMKNLGAAKRSAMSNAPIITHKVEIYDLMEKCLSRREGGAPWQNL